MCVCSLGYQYSTRIRPTFVCALSGSTIFFPLYLIRGKILGKSCCNIKRVLRVSLQLLSKIFLILRRTERDVIKMCIGLHVKHPLYLSGFDEN